LNKFSEQFAEHAGAIPGCAIYHGQVRHKRSSPRAHVFNYRLCLFAIDLDRVELAMSVSSLLGYERFAHSSFRRRDYFGDSTRDLAESIREFVASECGFRPSGPIQLVTQLRTLGYSFNPVTFYYCWNAEETALEAIVAEITNTPWGERHAYVLPWGEHSRRSQKWRFKKAFHISPFSPMELEHDWRFGIPGQRLGVHMLNRSPKSGAEFEATLLLAARPFTRREVRRALVRHPFMPGKTLLGIYWQALRLIAKRLPFHTHPSQKRAHPSRE